MLHCDLPCVLVLCRRVDGAYLGGEGTRGRGGEGVGGRTASLPGASTVYLTLQKHKASVALDSRARLARVRLEALVWRQGGGQGRREGSAALSTSEERDGGEVRGAPGTGPCCGRRGRCWSTLQVSAPDPWRRPCPPTQRRMGTAAASNQRPHPTQPYTCISPRNCRRRDRSTGLGTPMTPQVQTAARQR